ncbi:MAG: hypothetical protein HPAVJP_1640 [Candidatus Hepatoplasma vulgare]|nr:MAG: hypothetical protein HPAVJP_1640 [Candidatus Hepatoplasma sp.]
MNTKLDNDYFLGKLIKVENDIAYLHTTNFNLENKSYIIYKNKIFKTPYVGSFLKISSFGNYFIAKIISEKLFINEKNKYKIYKISLIGLLDDFYKIKNDYSFSPQVGNNASLFSNDELDKIESTKVEEGFYIENVGTIKDNRVPLAINIDFFASNILFVGNKNFGKTNLVFRIYRKFFFNYLKKFNKNYKFLFLNFESELHDDLKIISDKENYKGKFIEVGLENNSINLFKKEDLLLNDYYLLGEIKGNSEAKIAEDFFNWERNGYEDLNIGEIFNFVKSDERILNHFKNSFKALYRKRRELIKNNFNFSKLERYLNYALLNINSFLDNLFFKENKLFLKTALFKENKDFKKAFSSLYKYYKDVEYLELTGERFKWLRDFILLKENKNTFDVTFEFKKNIKKSFRLKLNFFVLKSLIEEKECNYDQIINFSSKFIKNWKIIKHLFYENDIELKENVFEKNNIFSFNFKNLGNNKSLFATIIIKKIYSKFIKISEKEKLLNIIIDSKEQLFDSKYDDSMYYVKYKNNFFKNLLIKGKENNVYSTYLSSSFKNLNVDILNLFNNFFVFNLTSSFDFQIILENFNIIEEDNIKKIRKFGYNNCYCFGKNFIRLLEIYFEENYNKQKREINNETTISKFLS